jgi:hypothetical protein
MRHRHGLISLIWAAIFLIAGQFAASPAFAHAGQPHNHSAASSPAVHAAHQGKSISKPQAAGDAEMSVTSSQRGDQPASQTSGCTGGCCGNGIGCCGAAIAAVSSLVLDFRVQQGPIPLALYGSSGIDPEALTRPPRTLA